MIQAIIFDFFGVIGLSTYHMLAEKYQYTPLQDKELWDLHRALDAGYVSQHDFIQTYAGVIGISEQEMIASFKEAENNMGIHWPVINLVSELKKKYKVGLLTNVSEDAYKFVTPIEQYFDTVVASYMVRIAKPDIAIYEIMAERLGVDTSECIMIDDNEINCEGARAAGMQAICFSTLVHLKKDLATYISIEK